MRHALIVLFLLEASCAFAADTPKDLQPLPEPPPPPANIQEEPDLEPQVTITKQAEAVVEEYRSHGKLYMIKVTPRTGVPYYLIDLKGDGTFIRQDHFDSRVRPPMWIIHQF